MTASTNDPSFEEIGEEVVSLKVPPKANDLRAGAAGATGYCTGVIGCWVTGYLTGAGLDWATGDALGGF